ncbi:MAG: hypothetical protein CM1200mP2_39420 [Planctomycetaceae bacterium]|nr:MAG: hypothetical protein CM1200mP2_39420 [Planctomycetaceae bacterium]
MSIPWPPQTASFRTAGQAGDFFPFLHGGISHVDTFDEKPELNKRNGQPVPFKKPGFEFAVTGNLLGSPWKFHSHGQSGLRIRSCFRGLVR